MNLSLPEVAVEDKGDWGALASKSSVLTPPTQSTAFTPPARPEAIGRVQQAISSLMPDFEKKRKATEEAEKAAVESRKATLPPAIAKLKEVAGAKQPPLPVEQPEPAVPDTSPRAFLGGEGKNALQQMVAGLSLLITAAAGARRAPAQALGALTGAMAGWAEGDAERASRDWHHYEGLVAKMNRENQQAMKRWERARVTRGDDLQAAQIMLQAQLSEVGLSDYAAEVAEKGFARTGQELTMAQGLLAKMDAEYNNQVRNALDQWKAGETHRHNEMLERNLAAKSKHADAALEELKKYHGELTQIKKIGPTAQLEKQRIKLTDGIHTLTEKNRAVDETLLMMDDLEKAVTVLDAKGVIPKGATYADETKAKLALQSSIGDTDVADAVQTIKRFGTSAVIRKELELMGGKGASIMRLKAIGEAEAGDILMPPKQWWDRFITGSRRVLAGSKTMNAPVLKAYQDMLRSLGGTALPTAAAPEPPPVDIKWED